MAPEQLEGRDVDTRADVFAFGAVLYEMVTGLKAFEAETPARVLSAILRDEPARVSTIVPVTPTGLDELIHTCLAKDPNERWQGMGDVARQLRWLQSALSSAKSGAVARSAVPPAPRARWRSWWIPAAAAIAGIAIGAAAMWLAPRHACGAAWRARAPAAAGEQLSDRRPGTVARRAHARVRHRRCQRRAADLDSSA